MKRHHAAQVSRQAYAIFEKLSFEAVADVLRQSVQPSPLVDRVLRRAGQDYERDGILGNGTMPRHLYFVHAILNDPAIPSTTLDCFISRLRQLVYHLASMEIA